MHQLLAALFVFCAAPALAQFDPVVVGPKDRYAKPLLVVTPIFPKNVSLEGLPVEIRVTGTVTTTGAFTTPVFSPAEGKQAYVQAVQDVLHEWRFRPSIDWITCRAVSTQAVVIVYFELRDGKPAILVSSPVAEKIAGIAGDEVPAPKRFERKPKPEYPRGMLNNGVEGKAEILLQVNGKGEILHKSVASSIPLPDFGRAAIESMSGSRFAMKESAAKPDVTACVTIPVLFCITHHDADFPSPECRPGETKTAR
jgi:TonB family protein